MKIINIRESGCNNILKWAIENNADIRNDTSIQSLINEETHYLMTLDDVSFFELFRLTQLYREKIRIIEEKAVDDIPTNELHELFKGEHIKDDTHYPLCDIANHTIQLFINLALQMNTDDDIIQPSTARLFIPMISRRYKIQIPINFVDLVESIDKEDEFNRLFSNDYPDNINRELVDSENTSFKIYFSSIFIKATSIIRYNSQYEKYLKFIKYSPLNTFKMHNIYNKLYKFALLGFSKYDNVNRTEVKCNLFKPDKEKWLASIKQLSRLQTPLKLDFVIQVPIQQMQILLNSLSHEELSIKFESSMSNILEDGIVFKNFNIKTFDEDEEGLVEHENSLHAYETRITECRESVLSAISILLEDKDSDINSSDVFSLLPSIYSTKAVITLNMQYIDRYINHYDSIISDMFNEMMKISSSIVNDINSSK